MTGLGLAATSPLAFALHPGAWIAILAVTATYAVLIRQSRFAATPRQAWAFIAAMGLLVVALTWPVASLAAHHLLLALVAQRLLLMLAVPPLLLTGLPRSLVAAITRPSWLDTAARVASRPVPAVVVVTVVAVGTLTVPAVQAQSASVLARAAFDIVLLGAGIVLWLPVLQPVPGTTKTSSLGRAGYLVVQSIVPSFLSIVWIFARHPLYPPYAYRGTVLGLSPLLDQQLAGFTAKLGTIFALWTVAFVVIARSERQAEGGDTQPLDWADVERELERVGRRERRAGGPPLEIAPETPERPHNTRRDGGAPRGEDPGTPS